MLEVASFALLDGFSWTANKAARIARVPGNVCRVARDVFQGARDIAKESIPAIALGAKDLWRETSTSTKAKYGAALAAGIYLGPASAANAAMPGLASAATAAVGLGAEASVLAATSTMGAFAAVNAVTAVSVGLQVPYFVADTVVRGAPLVADVVAAGSAAHSVASRVAHKIVSSSQAAQAQTVAHIQRIQTAVDDPNAVTVAAIPRAQGDRELPPPSIRMQQAKEKFQQTLSSHIILLVMDQAAGTKKSTFATEMPTMLREVDSGQKTLWQAYRSSTYGKNLSYWQLFKAWIVYNILGAAIPLIVESLLASGLNVFERLAGKKGNEQVRDLMVVLGQSLGTGLKAFNKGTESYATKQGRNLQEEQNNAVLNQSGQPIDLMAQFIVDQFLPRNRLLKWIVQKILKYQLQSSVQSFWDHLNKLATPSADPQAERKRKKELFKLKLTIIKMVPPVLQRIRDFMQQPFPSAPEEAPPLAGSEEMIQSVTEFLKAARLQYAFKQAQAQGKPEEEIREIMKAEVDAIAINSQKAFAAVSSVFGAVTEVSSKSAATAIGTYASLVTADPDSFLYNPLADFFEAQTEAMLEKSQAFYVASPLQDGSEYEGLDSLEALFTPDLRTQWKETTHEISALFDHLEKEGLQFAANDLAFGMPLSKAKKLFERLLNNRQIRLSQKFVYLRNALNELDGLVQQNPLPETITPHLLAVSRALGEIREILDQPTHYLPHSVQVALSEALAPFYLEFHTTLAAIEKLKPAFDETSKLKAAIDQLSQINLQTSEPELQHIIATLEALKLSDLAESLRINSQNRPACIHIANTQAPLLEARKNDALNCLTTNARASIESLDRAKTAVENAQARITPTFKEALSTLRLGTPFALLGQKIFRRIKVKEKPLKTQVAELAVSGLSLATEQPALIMGIAFSAMKMLASTAA